jgi:parallel beta-helix repeat protein
MMFVPPLVMTCAAMRLDGLRRTWPGFGSGRLPWRLLRLGGLFAVIALQSAAPCLAGELWVSTRGDDHNPGTRGSPMASVQGALDRDPAAHVFVGSGTYHLTKPIAMTRKNAGAIIEAADAGAPPILTGGSAIAGFTPAGQGLWQARTDLRFEQLWVNGRRATRARTPNEGWFFMKAPVAYLRDPKSGAPKDYSRSAFRADTAVIDLLKGLSEDELHDVQVNVWQSWSVSQLHVERVDRGEGIVFMGGSPMWPLFGFGPNQRFQLENLKAALDSPGEWFQARDGSIYYHPRPGEDMKTATVIAPVLSQLVVIDGADRVTLRGLRFEHSGYRMPSSGIPGAQAAAEVDAAIVVDGAHETKLLGIGIAHTGQYAVWFRKGCRDSVLERSLLEDLGAGGVRIGETGAVPDEAHLTSGIVVDNNIIRDGGHVFPGAVGVLIGHSGGNRVSSNEISGFFYTGISVGWVWGYGRSLAAGNVIEANHVHHLGFGLLSDMAGIYTLGVSPRTVVRGNVIHDVLSYDQHGRGGWGIYLDEGTSEILVENNLAYRTKSGGFHQHYGRDNTVRNNIFAFGKDAQLQRTLAEPHLSFTFTRNIVVTRGAPLLAGQWNDGNVRLDGNIYYDAGGAALAWGDASFATWQASGKDVHSIVADPQFVDLAKDDYRLRDSSPALKMGFVPLAPAGLSVDGKLRAEAAAVKYPAMKAMPAEPPPPALQLKDDFESQPAGSPPSFARVIVEGKGDSIAAASECALHGGEGLKMQDALGLAHQYDPHFFYQPHHLKGISTVRFAIRMGEGAQFFHEWRDAQAPYRAGPSLAIRSGSLRAAGKELGKIPPAQWVTIEIEAGVGAQSTGTWHLVVKTERESLVDARLPNRDASWRTLDWLGFVSDDDKASTICLDDVEIANR